MNKSELIDGISKSAKITKAEAQRALERFVELVSESLKSGVDVTMVGFGTFVTRKRKARKGRNPQTGVEIEIPESRVVVFRPGKALKTAVKEKTAKKGKK